MDGHSLHILDLPFEITAGILDFLSFSDLKDARLVCRKWYLASLIASSAKRECLVVDDDKDVSTLLTSERSFENICVTRKHSIWSMEDFWHRFGPKVQCLTIYSCTIAEDKLFKVFNACPKLENLVLGNFLTVKRSRPTVLSDFKLTNLKSIALVDLEHFDSSLCDFIVERAPNLKKIIVEQWLGTGKELLAPTSCHILPIASYMAKKPHIHFDLRLQFINANHLERRLFKKIVRGSNVHVTSLNTSEKCALRHLNPRGNLKELYVDSWSIDSIQFAEMCDSHPGLEKLTVERCDKIMSSIQNVCLLRNLTHLNLTCKEKSTKFSDEQIRGSLCSTVNTTLKTLRIAGCGQSENVIVELAKTHPSLSVLMIERSPNVTDWSIQAIFRYQVLLQSLRLSYCDNLTDGGLEGHLLPDYPSQPLRENPTGHPISRLKGLQRLSLQRCPKITGRIFEGGVAFPELRLVDLTNCKKITASAVRNLIEKHPMLEVLIIMKVLSKKDSDILVPVILSTLRRLTTVQMDTLSQDQERLLSLHCRFREWHDLDDSPEESQTSGDLSEGSFSEEPDCERESGAKNERNSKKSSEVPENVKGMPKIRRDEKCHRSQMKEEQGNEIDSRERGEKVLENIVSEENDDSRGNPKEKQDNSVGSETISTADEHTKSNQEKPLKKDEDEYDNCEVSDEEEEDELSESEAYFFFGGLNSTFDHNVKDLVEGFLGSEAESDELDEDSSNSLFSDDGPIWSDSDDDVLGNTLDEYVRYLRNCIDPAFN